MAFNVRPGGLAESVPVPDSVESGDLVRVGNLVGIAQIDATEGDDGNFYTTLALEGIANTEDVDGSVSVGQALYTGDSGPGTVELTQTGSGEGAKLVGIATREKGGAPGRVWYKLVPNVTITPAEPNGG